MEAVAGLIAIAALLLKMWLDSKPGRTKEAADGKVQQDRQDIVQGNADAVSKRVDNVLRDSAGSDNAGSKGGNDREGQASTVQRLGALGIRNE